MTVSEMHVAVKLGLDKSSALELPAFEPEELDYWLNVAQDKFIYGKYKDHKGDDKSKSMEAQEDLSSLIKYSAFTPSSISGFFGGKGHSINIDGLPTYTLRYVLSVIGKVSRQLENGTSVANSLVFCENISIKDLENYIITPYNQRPYFEKPGYFISQAYSSDPNRGMVIIVDYYTSTLTNVDLIYIREPKKLNRTTDNSTLTTTCELPAHTHKRIVDLTVFLLLENIESGRVQTNAITLNNNLNG